MRFSLMIAIGFAMILFTTGSFSQSPVRTSSNRVKVPQFRDYPAEPAWTGPNAPVRIDKGNRMYRTRLREGGKEPVNFAGHYIVIYWGCGTECRMHAIIDAKTGRNWFVPFSICCWNELETDENFHMVEFRKDSRLIIFSGQRNEGGILGTHFYEFRNGSFIFIKTIPAEAHREDQSSDPSDGDKTSAMFRSSPLAE